MVLTTFSGPILASLRTAIRFFSTCSVWTSMSPSTISLVRGSMGICPETNMKPPAITPCE